MSASNCVLYEHKCGYVYVCFIHPFFFFLSHLYSIVSTFMPSHLIPDANDESYRTNTHCQETGSEMTIKHYG